jgi:hypothetical protein
MVELVPSKGWGKPTSFVVANFTRAQLRQPPTDDRRYGKREIHHLAGTCLVAQFIGS